MKILNGSKLCWTVILVIAAIGATAREGKADLVISHYGYGGVKPFVAEGLGLWLHPILANQMILPRLPGDPAGDGRPTAATEAFRPGAASDFYFLSDNNACTKYLEEIIWRNAEGSTIRWLFDSTTAPPYANFFRLGTTSPVFGNTLVVGTTSAVPVPPSFLLLAGGLGGLGFIRRMRIKRTA